MVRYWKEDVEGDNRNAALNRVTDIARTTAEYINRIEATPQLGIGPKGDYRLLADFNDVVLAGHHIERFLSVNLRPRPDEVYDVYEIGGVDEEESGSAEEAEPLS